MLVGDLNYRNVNYLWLNGEVLTDFFLRCIYNTI